MSVRYKGKIVAEAVDTPVQGIVTQAEFDALPVEQQNKGMYVIDDGVKGGSSSGPSEEVYSTEETRIGTWIDGKPLYRKVYEAKITENDTIIAENVIGIQNIENITKIDGIYKSYLNDVYIYYGFPGATVTENSSFPMYAMINSSHNLEFYVSGEPIIVGTYHKVHIILEYTKTTDPGVTA